MFIDSAKLLMYLKRNSIEVYFPDSVEGPAVLKFPDNVVSHLEILDQDSYEKLLIEFLSQFEDKKHEVVLVLSPDAYFEKILKIEEGKETYKNDIGSFFDNLPFEDFKIGKKILTIETNLCLYATNKLLYEQLVKFLSQINWTVSFISPIGVFFNIPDSLKTLSTEIISQILQSKDLLKLSNLLEESENIPQGNTSYVFIILLVVILIGSLIYAGITFKVIR